MRFARVVVLAASLAVVAPRPARSDEPPTGAAPAAVPAPKQETVVNGTPPELAGRWLAVAWMNLPDNRTTNIPALWDIAPGDGKLELTQRFVQLPAEIQTSIDKANEAGTRWEPSPAQLAALDAGWATLAPDPNQHVAQVAHEIATPDGFDASLKGEPRTKDALWVVRQRQDMDRSGAPVIKQVFIYAALAPTDGGWKGNADTAAIAAAPFPIPISVKGDFRVYRVGTAPEVPHRGLMARLLDVFAGCGRTSAR
jgi:hypothetical protein